MTDLFRTDELVWLRREADELVAENRRLRADNGELRAKNARLVSEKFVLFSTLEHLCVLYGVPAPESPGRVVFDPRAFDPRRSP